MCQGFRSRVWRRYRKMIGCVSDGRVPSTAGRVAVGACGGVDGCQDGGRDDAGSHGLAPQPWLARGLEASRLAGWQGGGNLFRWLDHAMPGRRTENAIRFPVWLGIASQAMMIRRAIIVQAKEMDVFDHDAIGRFPCILRKYGGYSKSECACMPVNMSRPLCHRRKITAKSSRFSNDFNVRILSFGRRRRWARFS